MLVSILVSVIFRYVLSDPIPWANDFARISLSICIFSALAPALQHGAHVGLELAFDRLPKMINHGIKIVAWIATVVIICVWFYHSFLRMTAALEGSYSLPGLYLQVPSVPLYLFQTLCLLVFAMTALLLPWMKDSSEDTETSLQGA
ncbi:TRAP transporter small permease [Nesterenkonia alkaliphila]